MVSKVATRQPKRIDLEMISCHKALSTAAYVVVHMRKTVSTRGRIVCICWLTAGCLVSTFTLQSQAANRSWTGGGGSNNHWMTAANWGGTAPSPGDNLVFNGVSNAGNSSNYNDFPDGTVFGSIAINTAASQDYILGGNRIVLTNGISETAGGIGISQLAGFVDLNVTLGSNQTFTASHSLVFKGTLDMNGWILTNNNSGTITMAGLTTNSSGTDIVMIKTNSGTLTIASGGQFYMYETVIGQGSLVVDGVAHSEFFLENQSPVSLIIDGFVDGIDSGEFTFGTVSLSGAGTIARLDDDNAFTNTITPGDNGNPGILTMESFGLFTGPRTLLQFEINGTTPGTAYSQVVCSNYFLTVPTSFGSQQLSESCALNVYGSYLAVMGDSFLILNQTSNIPYLLITNGIFYDQPQNSIYEMTNGVSLAVKYDTNGVTLETVRVPSSPFVLWKGTAPPDLGEYGDRHWSTASNWAGGVLPTSGSHVEFTPYQITDIGNPSGGPPPPLTNNLSVGLSIASLLFTSNNYILYGNPLTITGGITNQTSSGTNASYIDVATAGPLPIEVDAGGTFVLGGSIDGSGTVSKEGGGTLMYTGTTMDSYVGTVVVDNGTLQVDGLFTDGSFTVNGGQLDGTGTISSVTMNGGTLKPGDSPGVLHIQGSLTMSAAATFKSELNSPVPGSGYGQLQVTGGVNLNGATLNLQPGYSVVPGTSFLIIINNSGSATAGTFAGLPEGATFQAGGQYFSISYKAGSGSNDVVVTRLNVPGNFKSIGLLSSNVVQLQGLGGSNVNYRIQSNTNLATTNWQNIGSVTADSSGNFQFNVSNLMSRPQQFFRTATP